MFLRKMTRSQSTVEQAVVTHKNVNIHILAVWSFHKVLYKKLPVEEFSHPSFLPLLLPRGREVVMRY